MADLSWRSFHIVLSIVKSCDDAQQSVLHTDILYLIRFISEPSPFRGPQEPRIDPERTTLRV
jgi:hypothetical protein